MSKNILKKKRISIREYQPEDRERVINLLNAPSIKPEIWEWQFDNRHYKSSIKPIVAEDRWGNILGFNGMMPVKLHTQDYGELEAAWSCDFFVSRHCRGLGVGKEIKRELKAQSDLTFALGTSPTAAIVLEQSGWIPYKKAFNFSTNNLHLLVQPTNQLISSEQLPESEHINALWERHKHELGASIKRDAAYMKWRYKHSPVAKYKFLIQIENKTLKFIAVYRLNAEHVSLVDYLGPNSGEVHKLVLGALSKMHSRFMCMTSCPSWHKTFSDIGMQKAENPVNCFIYAQDKAMAEQINERFYLMPGDCDGDFLGSSVSQAIERDDQTKPCYQTEQITFETFLTMEADWDDLVKGSDNTSLFSSWLWVKTWWEAFSARNKFELQLLLCRYNQRLVGIAPMYTRRYRQFFVPVKQLQLIGCSWSGPNTFRSEYLDLIIKKEHSRGARIALLDHIHEKLNWDELILGDIPHTSLTTRLMEEIYKDYGSYIRTVHEDHSVVVDCTIDQQTYTSMLSSNFRRSVIHKYTQLKEESNCDFKTYNNNQSCPINVISTLNALHIPRWGKPCFEGVHKNFHETLITEFGRKEALDIGILKVDDKLSALTYNLCFANTVHNIQLGYTEEFKTNYSLGLIHLTQNILNCINDANKSFFDLLAGFGKKEYYKERFGGQIKNIATKQYLKGRWVKLVYKIYDKTNRK